MTREESDWKQYDMAAATVRSSLELVLKANMFYYAVTGAILSFYFSRPEPVPPHLRFVLGFPVLMAGAMAVIFWLAASTMWRGEEQLREITGRLRLTAYPDTVALRRTLRASAVLLLALAAALLLELFCGTLLGLHR
jgi:hypothetical protein